MTQRPTFFQPHFLALLISLCLTSVHAATAATWSARAQPAKIVNGGPVLFRVKPPQPLSLLTATWLGHEVTFSFDATSKTWFALAGVSIETAPGTYPLELIRRDASGKNTRAGNFLHSQLRRSPRQVSQNTGQAQCGKQIHRAQPRTAKANRRSSANKKRLPEPRHSRARMVRTILHARGRSALRCLRFCSASSTARLPALT